MNRGGGFFLREEKMYTTLDFALGEIKGGECWLPSLSPLPHSTLPLCEHVCWCVRFSRLRCCSLPPQTSREEEEKRLDLARGKREEFGFDVPDRCALVIFSGSSSRAHTCGGRLMHTHAGWMLG